MKTEPPCLWGARSLGLEICGRQGNEAIGNCPFCEKERHLYFNIQKAVFDCKKCGEAGSFTKLCDQLQKQTIADFNTGKCELLARDRGLSPEAFEGGYAEAYLDRKKPVLEGIQETNNGCPGETTDSMIGNGPLGAALDPLEGESPCGYHKIGFPLHNEYGGSKSQPPIRKAILRRPQEPAGRNRHVETILAARVEDEVGRGCGRLGGVVCRSAQVVWCSASVRPRLTR